MEIGTEGHELPNEEKTLYVQGIEVSSSARAEKLFLATKTGSCVSDEIRLTVVAVEIADGEGNPLVGQQCRCVGQKIDLKAHIAPAGVFDESSYEWTIPGEKIKDYVVHDEQKSSEILPLTEDQLESDAIDFYWVDGAQEREVNLVVKIDGLIFTDVVGFEVQAPTLNSFTSKSGTVNVSELADIWRISSGIFGQEFGMEWTADVVAPPNFGGTFKFVQLVTANVQWTLKSGATESQRIQPPWWLDINDPFQGYSWVCLSGENNAHELIGDTPKVWLQDGDKKAEIHSWKYQTYLMFEPDVSEDSVYIPVGVVDWGWSAVAERTGLLQTWELISGSHDQEDPSGIPVKDFPVWIMKRIAGYPPRVPD